MNKLVLAILLVITPITSAQADRIEPAGSMVRGTSQHAAVRLQDGRVVVVGGDRDSGGETTIQLFDPASRAWSKLGDLSEPRFVHSANLLPDGRIYVAGGFSDSGQFLRTAEILDADGHSTPAPELIENRDNQRTAELADGRVLLITGDNERNGYIRSTEIFDPKSNKNLPGPSFPIGRSMGAAAPLSDEMHLICGGISEEVEGQMEYLRNAYLYSAEDNAIYQTNHMLHARKQHTATSLGDGLVLVAGGMNESGSVAETEIYDLRTNLFTPGPALNEPRYGHTATLLPSGRVLIAGGTTSEGVTASTEIIDIAAGTSTAGPAMSHARALHSATALEDGSVLLAGGLNRADGWQYPAEAELFIED